MSCKSMVLGSLVTTVLLTQGGCQDASHSYAELAFAEVAATPVYAVFGDGTFSPTKLDYQIAQSSDANNCEFYVNAFGRGSWSHASANRRWIESYLSVNKADLVDRQRGKIRNAGMFAQWTGLNADSPSGSGLFLGREIEAGYFSTQFLFDENVHGGTIVEVRRQIDAMAFFLDIERADRSVERLWISQNGKNFTVDEIVDGYRESFKSLGSGVVRYVEGDSPVYAQKFACQ